LHRGSTHHQTPSIRGHSLFVSGRDGETAESLRFARLFGTELRRDCLAPTLHHASREMSASIDPARYAAPAIVDRLVAEGRLGLKSGSGFYDYAGRDLGAYRRDVLARTLGMLNHAGLWRAASDETLP
jgi:3-hydroxybutyryl-CoA dehydrogenase